MTVAFFLRIACQRHARIGLSKNAILPDKNLTIDSKDRPDEKDFASQRLIFCSFLHCGIHKSASDQVEAQFGLGKWLLPIIFTRSAGGRGFNAINQMCLLALWGQQG